MQHNNKWTPFSDVINLFIRQFDDQLIGWAEIEQALKSGRIRARALYTKYHELTGKIISREERLLSKEWWNVSGRFGRLLGQPVMFSDVDRVSIASAYSPPACSHDEIKLYLPEVYAVLKVEPTIERSSDPKLNRGEPKRRGPKPSVSPAVKSKMREFDRARLMSMGEEEMSVTFNASRDTCRKVREAVLSEFVDNSNTDK